MKAGKKRYVRPELRAQRITLGVYGNYQGDVVVPLTPIVNKDLGGDIERQR
jgi:hypothetical protein